MKDTLTPKQVAQAIGVSEASLKRWCDKGVLPATRTAGGHRRLPVAGVVQWLRETGHAVVQPEVLGLPSNTGSADATLDRSAALFESGLRCGDTERCRQIVLNLFRTSHSIASICDEVIAPAFHSIGSAWQHGEVEVYQERRGCEISLGLIREMRNLLPAPAATAPYAIGGTLSDDPYSLPNAMVEVALLEAGWRAESHGSGNPASTLAAAIRDRRPRLFWLSASTIGSMDAWLDEYRLLATSAEAAGVPFVVGGRAMVADVRRQISYAAHCDRLAHLISFAQAIHT